MRALSHYSYVLPVMCSSVWVLVRAMKSSVAMAPKKADTTSASTQLTIAQAISHNNGSVALSVDVGKEFESAVVDGKLTSTINDALTYCTAAVAVASEPLGISCPARTVSQVREASTAASGKTGSAGGLFGGCLGFLALGQDAFPQSTDVGKIGRLLADMKLASDIKDLTGTVIVNMDQMSANTWEPNSLKRANKDAEITAVCLTLYYHREAPHDVCDALVLASKDFVLDGRNLGSGVEFETHKLALAEKEEAEREVLGLSSRRKCLFLADLADQAKKEKLGKDGANDADNLSEALKKNSYFSSWNLDTCRRFLLIGRRLNSGKLASLLDLWEFYHGRGTLVDSISVLRGLCGVFFLNLRPRLRRIYLYSNPHYETLNASIRFCLCEVM